LEKAKDNEEIKKIINEYCQKHKKKIIKIEL
jgi:molybdopterin/thiamine biosynthesis adenylyltransferase